MFTLGVLKHGMILFWAVWYSVVLATNVTDALKALGVLGARWKCCSGNWQFLKETTAIYSMPSRLVAVFFAAIIAWEAFATVLMWRAFQAFQGVGQEAGLQAVYAAFAAALVQFGVFVIADEAFVAYPVAATHMRILILLIASVLAIGLLPDGP